MRPFPQQPSEGGPRQKANCLHGTPWNSRVVIGTFPAPLPKLLYLGSGTGKNMFRSQRALQVGDRRDGARTLSTVVGSFGHAQKRLPQAARLAKRLPDQAIGSALIVPPLVFRIPIWADFSTPSWEPAAKSSPKIHLRRFEWHAACPPKSRRVAFRTLEHDLHGGASHNCSPRHSERRPG